MDEKRAVQWAVYDASVDAPFLPKDIFSESLCVDGLTLCDEALCADGEGSVYVLAGEWGKCYEIKMADAAFKAVRFSADPRALKVGEQLAYEAAAVECDDDTCFMYTCRHEGEYLVIGGAKAPFYIGERTILAKEDTPGEWYYPQPIGNVGEGGTLGEFTWVAQEFIDNLYEPVRARHPEYITRTEIGKDESGEHTMYCYEYTPENYEITMFLTSGVHGCEGVGYYAISKIMQLIADATPEDKMLYTLRQQVRFVVIPLVNMWGMSHEHIRPNCAGHDLNRDFENLTQQETRNVMACFEKYVKDVSIAMDFHTSYDPNVEVWFNFINFTDNAVANYKTTNHLYHRYCDLGYTVEKTDMTRLPGKYRKKSMYLEGAIWNKYGVPTITAEYTVNGKMPTPYSETAMTLAVETYGNLIIQNALFFLQKNR